MQGSKVTGEVLVRRPAIVWAARWLSVSLTGLVALGTFGASLTLASVIATRLITELPYYWTIAVVAVALTIGTFGLAAWNMRDVLRSRREVAPEVIGDAFTFAVAGIGCLLAAGVLGIIYLIFAVNPIM